MSNSANIAADRIRFPSTFGDVTAAAPSKSGRRSAPTIPHFVQTRRVDLADHLSRGRRQLLKSRLRADGHSGGRTPKKAPSFNVRNLGDQMRAQTARSQRLFTTFATECRSTTQCDSRR
jgi:hypothetical protein